MIAYRSYAHNNLIMFIRSRAPETTLLPSYPGGANVSLTSLQNSTNSLYDDCEPLSGARQLGWASCATLASGTTFLHVNTFARLTGTSLGMAGVTKCLD